MSKNEKAKVYDLYPATCYTCGFTTDVHDENTYFGVINENKTNVLVVCPKCGMTQIQ